MDRAKSKSIRGGCFECHGHDVHWTAKNTVGVASRHAELTGHKVWVEIVLSITYNPKYKYLLSEE